MEFQAVVMAAGRGSRMTDLTASIPKPLLPIGNRPMIWYPVNMLETAGFQEVIIIALESTSHDIRQALTALCDVKVSLDIVGIPDDADWGTADSLRHIKDKIQTDILVVSCDLVCNVPLHQLADIHRMHNSTLTMLLADLPQTTDSAAILKSKKIGNEQRDFIGLDGDGRRVVIMASEADLDDALTVRRSVLKRHPCVRIKTKLQDAHLFLLKKWVVDYLQQNRSVSTIKGELVPLLVRKQFSRRKKPADVSKAGDLSMVSPPSTKEDNLDIHSFDEDDEMTLLTRSLSSGAGQRVDGTQDSTITCYTHIVTEGMCVRANTLPSYVEANKQILHELAGGDELLVHPSITTKGKYQIGPECMVGEGVSLGDKVTLKKSIIGKHCTIGDRVKITNSVIMNHVTIKDGSILQGCVVCDNAHMGDQCELKDSLVGSSQNIPSKAKYSNEVIVNEEQMLEV
ncbi:translation initiation factor eIF2B subunit gamma-like [Branchiostoma lanceolatum]|uniref:translation initiation factor eIF2B subunit gamma-like n=1 Tax=Branchiostoma lanceolatum TaxID=7740 RepID=UPI0034541071